MALSLPLPQFQFRLFSPSISDADACKTAMDPLKTPTHSHTLTGTHMAHVEVIKHTDTQEKGVRFSPLFVFTTFVHTCARVRERVLYFHFSLL